MKAMLIFNPAAGARDVRRELGRVIAYWEGRGWQVSSRETWGPGDATTFAREAVVTGHQAVFVAGGDGTVGETADGLAGSDVALGVLPTGAGNVWALEMGIPTPSPMRRHPLLDAAEVLAEGTLVYAVAAVLVAKDSRGTRTRVIIDGHRIATRSMLVIVSNAQLYAKLVRVAAEAYLDDGLLDVCIFKGVNLASTVHHAIKVFARRHLRDPQVEYYQCKKVSISTATPLPVQVDGDPIGTTPMEFQIVPQALNIIVPQNSSKRLFLNAQSEQPKTLR
jgi:diacylglycerol kinase (ATP)